ncbi:MAG: hypothetical protein ACR2FE_10980 [Aeromicrobium sp.]
MTKTPAYRSSAGSVRGAARRAALVQLISHDLARYGLVDFSLRSAEQLLGEAIQRLRIERIENALAVAASAATLADRVRSVWPVLMKDDTELSRLDGPLLGTSTSNILSTDPRGDRLPTRGTVCGIPERGTTTGTAQVNRRTTGLIVPQDPPGAMPGEGRATGTRLPRCDRPSWVHSSRQGGARSG